jgi:hypothetical protein
MIAPARPLWRLHSGMLRDPAQFVIRRFSTTRDRWSGILLFSDKSFYKLSKRYLTGRFGGVLSLVITAPQRNR